jgi:hypothetical protein
VFGDTGQPRPQFADRRKYLFFKGRFDVFIGNTSNNLGKWNERMSGLLIGHKNPHPSSTAGTEFSAINKAA